MTFENFIKSRLIMFAVGETVNDPAARDVLAVVQCLANRVAVGWFGGDWMQVIDNAPDVVGTTYPENSRSTAATRTSAKCSGASTMFITARQRARFRSRASTATAFITRCTTAMAHNVNREWFKKHVLSDPETHRMSSTGGVADVFHVMSRDGRRSNDYRKNFSASWH